MCIAHPAVEIAERRQFKLPVDGHTPFTRAVLQIGREFVERILFIAVGLPEHIQKFKAVSGFTHMVIPFIDLRLCLIIPEASHIGSELKRSTL